MVDSVDHHAQQQTRCIDQHRTVRALDLLARVVAAEAARADPLDRLAVDDGVGGLVQRWKSWRTVPSGGKSWGKALLAQPLTSTCKVALTTSRRSVTGYHRPPGE
jgi:hypothetical protein